MAIASDSFTGVDLSRLPAPQVIESLDFETIYADALAQFRTFFPQFDATVESDPVVKLLQLFAYRELVFRQRVNDAARAVMPAYAIGADLDHVAAIVGVERFILKPADPVTGAPAVLESDDDLRRRMVLAPEGFSVAGPEGAYIFHALSANSDVLDASATSPSPGHVLVTVLSRSGNGEPDADVLADVYARISSGNVRPLTDLVTVLGADVIEYQVNATLTFLAGPDRSVVMAHARTMLDQYIAETHRLGRDVTRAGIIAALFQQGVQNVALASPAADISLTRQQAAYCTAITITDSGVGE